MTFHQQIAIGVSVLAYTLILAYWLWAGISYMASIKLLPASKDKCNEYGKIVLSKIYLAAVVTGPASAIFGLLKS